MTDPAVPSAERDLGRVEGKMDILLAIVSRMEQDSKVGAEMISQRFTKTDERISRVQREATEANKKTDDRVTQLRTRVLVGAATLAGGIAAATGSLKAVVTTVLHMAF